MKHKLVTSLFVAFAASACMAGELLPDKSFSIANTNFFFYFEDNALTASNQNRIADDILAIRNFGMTSEATFKPVLGFDGYICNNNLDDTPYHSEELQFPRYVKCVNSTNALFLSKELSDAYTNRFAFLDANTNMFLSSISFVQGLSSNRLDALSSNDIQHVIFYNGARPEDYATLRDEVVAQLKHQRYGNPSALSYYQTGPGTNGFPHAATWMRVPVISWSNFAHSQLISVFHAFWYDGMWRLYPTEW